MSQAKIYVFSKGGFRKVNPDGDAGKKMKAMFAKDGGTTLREAISRLDKSKMTKAKKNEVADDMRSLAQDSIEANPSNRTVFQEIWREAEAMAGRKEWVQRLQLEQQEASAGKEEEEAETASEAMSAERRAMKARSTQMELEQAKMAREARGGAGGAGEEEEREAKGAEDDDKPTRMVVREDEVLPTTPAELKAYIGTGDGVDERIRELYIRYKDNGMGGTFERLTTEVEAGVRQAMLQDGVSMEGHEGSLTEPSTSVPPSVPSRGLSSGTPSGFTPSESSVTGSSFTGSSFTGSSFTGSTPPPSFVGGAGGAGGAPPPPPPAGGAPPPPAGAPAPAGGAPAGIGGHEGMEEKQGDEEVAEEDNAIKALKKSETVMDDSFNISKIGRDSPDELNKHQVIYRKLIETLFVSHSYIRLENRMVQRPELIQMLDSDKEVELFNRAVKMVGVYSDHLGIENPRYGIDAGVSTLKQQLIELYTCCYHVRKNLGRSDKKSALDSYNRVGVIVSASSMGLTLDSLLQWAQNNRSTAGDTSGLANQRLKKPLQNMNNSDLSQDKGRRTIGDIFNGRVSGLTHSDKPYLLGGNNQHMGQIDEEGGSKFRRSILMPERKSEGDNQRWKSFNWRMARSKKFDRKKIC